MSEHSAYHVMNMVQDSKIHVHTESFDPNPSPLFRFMFQSSIPTHTSEIPPLQRTDSFVILCPCHLTSWLMGK